MRMIVRILHKLLKRVDLFQVPTAVSWDLMFPKSCFIIHIKTMHPFTNEESCFSANCHKRSPMDAMFHDLHALTFKPSTFLERPTWDEATKAILFYLSIPLHRYFLHILSIYLRVFSELR